MTKLEPANAFNPQLFINLPLSGTLLTVLIAYLPRSVFLRFIAFSLISYFYYDSFKYRTGEWFLDYVTGCTIASQAFAGFYLVFLANPLDNFRHEKDTVSPREMPCLQRLSWAHRVVNSPLGVGWSYNVLKINSRPKDTRTYFVISRLCHSIGYYMLLDVCRTFIHYNPLFGFPGSTEVFPVSAQGIVMTPINSLAFGVSGIAAISVLYTVSAVIAVATGISEPQNWPPAFGSLSNAYSLRRFWGRTWHQFMYRFLSESGRSAARMLNFHPSSRASTITQLILAFLISGLVHAAGDFMVDPKHFGVSLPFFLYQVIGIVLEDITLQTWSQTGIRVSPYLSKALGFLWVCCWLTLTGPSYVNALAVLGMQNRKVVLPQLSPCMIILEGLQRRTGVVISDLFPTPRGRTL